jgi:hypothetical protein
MRFHWYSMDAAMLVLVAVYCFVRFVQGGTLRWLALAGLGTGASVLFKQNHGLFAWGAGLFLCAVLGLRRDRLTDGTPGRGGLAVTRVVAQSLVFTVATLAPVVVFLGYYLAAGGRLDEVWASTVIAPQRSYEYESALEVLIHPLRVFLLVHRRDPYAYMGTGLLLIGLVLLLARSERTTRNRLFGGLLVGLVMLWDVETFARILVFPLNFLIVVLATAFAALDYGSNRGSTLSACRLSLAVFGLANLYGGTIVGGGWARITETMTGSFYAYAVLVDVIQRNTAIQHWWNLRVAWRQTTVVGAAACAAVLWGLLMLADNRGFRPWIDFPLYRLDRSMSVEGARGIVGFGPFVADTDAVVRKVQDILSERASREIFVFPLNCMVYPLAGATNSTTFDTLQSNPFMVELIPTLRGQLDQRPPSVVVMQTRANHTLEPPLESNRVWVVPESVFAVRDFLRSHRYRKEYESIFYEVYTRSDGATEVRH